AGVAADSRVPRHGAMHGRRRCGPRCSVHRRTDGSVPRIPEPAGVPRVRAHLRRGRRAPRGVRAMSVIEAALKTLAGLLAREPVTIVRGVVDLVRTALRQPDKAAALARAKRAAAGKSVVETAVNATLKAKSRKS